MFKLRHTGHCHAAYTDYFALPRPGLLLVHGTMQVFVFLTFHCNHLPFLHSIKKLSPNRQLILAMP